ncbi:MAG: PLDc N-terminal domain-containing protein [Oscillospiraceae bacterium]
MLADIASIIKTYQITGFFTKLPIYIPIIDSLLLISTIITCIIMDEKTLIRPDYYHSHNSIHTMVWLCIILMFPVIGAVAYWIGSFIPYFVLSKKHSFDNGKPYPYTIPLKKWQLAGVILTCIIGMLIGKEWTYGIPFFGWVVMVVIDWYQSLYRKAIYLQVSSKEDRLEKGETILNVEVERSIDIAYDNYTTMKIIREMADNVFAEMSTGATLQGKSGKIVHHAVTYHYKVVQTEMLWREAERDVIEANYMGKGITKYTVLLWNDNDIPFMERSIYRAIPKSFAWFARMFILQFIILALNSTWGSFFHIGAIKWIASIFQ